MEDKGFIEFGNGLYYDPNDGGIYSDQGNGIYRLIKKVNLSKLPSGLRNYVLREITPNSTHHVSRGRKEGYIDPKDKGKEFYIQERGFDEKRNIVWELVCDKKGIPEKFLERGKR